MKVKICLLFFVLCLCSCKKIFQDEEFSLKCVPYTCSKLRIDGYYYQKRHGIEDDNRKFIEYYIFYSNGVSTKGSRETENISDVENSIATRSDNKYLPNNLYVWGPFSIHENKMRMQYYEISDYLSKRVLELSCTILNDTTFSLDKIHLVGTGKDVTNNYTFITIGEYHFKQFSPKPDSTNNFIP